MIHRLPMPVLAMGGAESLGTKAAETKKLTADDVQTLVIPDTGHWLAEQPPTKWSRRWTRSWSPTGPDRKQILAMGCTS